MLYETDTSGPGRPETRSPSTAAALAVAAAGRTDAQHPWYERSKRVRPVPIVAVADPLRAVMVRPVVTAAAAAAYVEHTFAAGLTAFREYNANALRAIRSRRQYYYY